MRAFYITEPHSHELRELHEPKAADGEVLLKTRLIGFCGTDLSTFCGKNPLVSYPRIPGHEIAATIVARGSGVPEHFVTGADVTVYPNTSCGICASCRRGRTNACKNNQTLGVQRDGALCDYFTIRWEKVCFGSGLSLRELSAVEPLAVGFHAVERSRVKPSDTVAVLGCGMVGLGAIAAAERKGARVVAIDLDDKKLALARQAGAQNVINSRTANLRDALGELTSGLGPDVVIEAVGSVQTYRLAVEIVAHTGRVTYIGWTDEPVAYETKLFVHKELDILGSRNYLNEFGPVIEMLSKGQFPVEQMISETVPMERAGDALRRWSESRQSFTKILVEVNP
ncbi:MAG: zinc-binding alcohol dehydrogenase family protein [Acidobacteriaceae bacterium]|nr:zinc-binding alcohol dehydrogenase family protein [Acidobacteriaceae bacterium]